MNVCELYLSGMNITEAANQTGLSKSSARRIIIDAGILRPRPSAHKEEFVRMYDQGEEVLDIARAYGCCATTVRRYLREAGSFKRWRSANGVRISSNGYVEYTTGEHKGRSVHVVAMESRLGRKILKDEVVHHIDNDKMNNDIDNLALMTRSAHTRLHRREDQLSNNERERDSLGRLK